MRLLIYFIFCFSVFLSFPASAQDQDAPETSDSKNIEIDGALLLGFDPRPCEPSLEGYVRYSSAEKQVQFCDGKTWLSWGAK